MSEYLSRDILEASYVRSFAPFRVLQAMLGSCRVDVRHSFVTPPTVRQKIYSVLVSIVTLVSYIFLVDFYIVHLFEYEHLYNLCLFGMVLNYAVYCSSMFNARFCNNEANAKFYVKLQEIDRKLNIEKSSYFDDFVFKRNIAALTLSMSIDLILFLASVCRNYGATLMSLGNFVSQVTCLIEWMHYSNIIVFLYARIYFINTIVMNHLKLDQNSYVKTFDVNSNKFWKTVQNLATETNDFRHSDIVDCFKEVFIALRMFTVLYRFQMFLFCLKIVAYTFFLIKFFILSLQNNNNIEENTYKAFYFTSPDSETTDLEIISNLGKKRSASPLARLDDLFDVQKRKIKKLSSSVSRVQKNGSTAFASTNADDEQNSSHLIKIEVFDSKKISKIPTNEHWKNTET